MENTVTLQCNTIHLIMHGLCLWVWNTSHAFLNLSFLKHCQIHTAFLVSKNNVWFGYIDYLWKLCLATLKRAQNFTKKVSQQELTRPNTEMIWFTSENNKYWANINNAMNILYFEKEIRLFNSTFLSYIN